jgi:Tfp pilus assembly protein PilZ
MNQQREKRREKRVRQRITCKLSIEGREHPGTVLDVSRHGLFVQTKAKAAPGTRVEVQLKLADRDAPLVVDSNVARLNRVPPALAPVWTAGLGLSVTRPPPAWMELVEAFARSKGGLGGSIDVKAAGALRSYCVRAALIQGTRTRTVLVRCASETVARELALAELGEEWKILSAEIASS